MAMLSPEADVATALAAALTLTVGTQIKYGPRRSPTEPGNDAVLFWVAPYSESADPLLNAAVEGSLYSTRVQIECLGPADDRATALVNARAARDALHAKQPSQYVSWVLVPGLGGPIYIGTNEAGQHIYTINIEAKWQGVAA